MKGATKQAPGRHCDVPGVRPDRDREWVHADFPRSIWVPKASQPPAPALPFLVVKQSRKETVSWKAVFQTQASTLPQWPISQQTPPSRSHGLSNNLACLMIKRSTTCLISSTSTATFLKTILCRLPCSLGGGHTCADSSRQRARITTRGPAFAPQRDWHGLGRTPVVAITPRHAAASVSAEGVGSVALAFLGKSAFDNDRPHFPASVRTASCHQRGIWLAAFQLDTVEGVNSNPAATADVPPQSSMICCAVCIMAESVTENVTTKQEKLRKP